MMEIGQFDEKYQKKILVENEKNLTKITGPSILGQTHW